MTRCEQIALEVITHRHVLTAAAEFEVRASVAVVFYHAQARSYCSSRIEERASEAVWGAESLLFQNSQLKPPPNPGRRVFPSLTPKQFA